MVDTSANFSGSIPEYYDSCMGPAWFEAMGADLARRLLVRPPGNVLELACGTGIVTRHLRQRVDPALRLVATDISKAMLDYARKKLADLHYPRSCKTLEGAGVDLVKKQSTPTPLEVSSGSGCRLS